MNEKYKAGTIGCGEIQAKLDASRAANGIYKAGISELRASRNEAERRGGEHLVRIAELEAAITEALPVLAEVDNKVILENAVAYQDRTIDDRYSRAVARLSRALEGER